MIDDDEEDLGPFRPNNLSRPWTLAEVYADLGGRYEITKTLNITRTRLERWFMNRERLGIPRPLRRIGHTDIYSMQEWKDWYRLWQENHGSHHKVATALPHGSGESFWEYFDKDMP